MEFVEIVNGLSLVLIVAFGLFLLGLAAVVVAAPSAADRFLGSFASSASAHYMEQGVRLLVGAAIVHRAGAMWYPELFRAFGWLLVVTTIGLLLVPWQWHQRFATRVMPPVLRRRGWFALGAAVMGAAILYAVSPAVMR